MYLDLKAMTYMEARAPEIVDDVVFFTYQSDPPVRHVAARFAHEDFRLMHSYSRNEYGIFVLDFPIPEGTTVLRYRIVVDGLWMRDPANPSVEVDRRGEEFSVLEIGRQERFTANPRPQKDGSALFSFRGGTGKAIALVGDFNNWDPFLDRLRETEPGVYEISLRLRSGSHGYYFLIDGDRRLDPRNFETMETQDGLVVSVFSWPPPRETAAAAAPNAAPPSGSGSRH
jgi:1,4-alpha-glucan branching enzyme